MNLRDIVEVNPTEIRDGLHMGRCQPGKEPTLSLRCLGLSLCSSSELFFKEVHVWGNEHACVFGRVEFGVSLGRLNVNDKWEINQSGVVWGDQAGDFNLTGIRR